MIKGQATTIYIHAWNFENQDHQTGDAANITLRISKDGGTPSAVSGTLNELSAGNMPGVYELALSTSETDADSICIHGVSSTQGVKISPLSVLTERGLVSPIKTQTDKLQFAGDNDLKVTLDTETVDLTTLSKDDIINGLMSKTITIAGGLTFEQAIASHILLGTNSVPTADPGTGTLIIQDSEGNTLLVLEYTTDVDGNITSRFISS